MPRSLFSFKFFFFVSVGQLLLRANMLIQKKNFIKKIIFTINISSNSFSLYKSFLLIICKWLKRLRENEEEIINDREGNPVNESLSFQSSVCQYKIKEKANSRWLKMNRARQDYDGHTRCGKRTKTWSHLIQYQLNVERCDRWVFVSFPLVPIFFLVTAWSG